MAHAMAPEDQKRIREMPGNSLCVDCGAPQPSWASVSYGTLFCLECSGRHRSLGVHLSFVRSVTMDSWSDKQLRAMAVGGNAKLIDFLKRRGADKLPIVQKYNTPAAAMYRDIIIALRDGKPPPTDIAPYEAEIAEDERRRIERSSTPGGSSAGGGGGGTTGFGSASSGGGGGGGGVGGDRGGAESPTERELRLRAEAQDRLRAKFGSGGLKGQSANNNGFGSASSSGSGGAGRPGGSGAPEDIFGVDIAAANQRLSAFAGSAFSKLSEVAKVTSKSVVDGTSSLSRKVQDAHVGEKLSGAVSAATAAVTDPELLGNVQKGATSFWNKAANVGAGLWTQAASAAKTIAADLGVPAAGGAGGGAGGGGAGGFAAFRDDDDHHTPPPGAAADAAGQGASARGAPFARAPSGSGGGAARRPSPGIGGDAAAAASAGGPAPAPSRAAQDDDDWLAQQVAQVQMRPAASAGSLGGSVGGVRRSGSRGGDAGAPAAAAATAADPWEVDSWETDDVTAAAAESAPAAAARSTPQAAAGSAGGAGRATPGAAASGAPAPAAAAAPEAAAAADDDDFFGSFGVKGAAAPPSPPPARLPAVIRVHGVGHPRYFFDALLADKRVIEQRYNTTFVSVPSLANADVVSVSVYTTSTRQRLYALLRAARRRGQLTVFTTFENLDLTHVCEPARDDTLAAARAWVPGSCPFRRPWHYRTHQAYYLGAADLSTGFRHVPPGSGRDGGHYVRHPNWLRRVPVERGACVVPGAWLRGAPWPRPDEWLRRPGGTAYISRHAPEPRPLLVGAFSSPAAVAALGPFTAPSKSFHNAPWPTAPATRARVSKREVLEAHRFVLVPENSRGDGYVTEKLFEAHVAGAVPIYWGGEVPPEPAILNPRRILFFAGGGNASAVLAAAAALVSDAAARAAFFAEPIAAPGAEAALDALCARFSDAFAAAWGRVQARRARMRLPPAGTAVPSPSPRMARRRPPPLPAPTAGSAAPRAPPSNGLQRVAPLTGTPRQRATRGIEP